MGAQSDVATEAPGVLHPVSMTRKFGSLGQRLSDRAF
jgi:hypothetical protein